MAETSDLEHAMLTYLKTFEEYKDEKLSLEKFTDGWAFATILQAAQGFKVSYAELIESSEKWTFKLTNLKKILQLIEEYFEFNINKGIKTKDVDLLEIAKNNNVEELLKLFQLVIAVMTEAPNKESHIGVIMSLDQRSQTAFVHIIQNIQKQRLLQKNQSKQDKIISIMDQLTNQNSLLRQQVESILKHNYQIEKQCEQLKLKQEDYEQEIEKLRSQQFSGKKLTGDQPKEKQHLKALIENLKEKLILTVRENEEKLSQYREQITVLQHKLVKYDQMEEEFTSLKKLQQEQKQLAHKNRSYDREREKLKRMVEEKEQKIRKLEGKLSQYSELNCGMQEKQVMMKIQLEKREIRVKELEKKYKGQQMMGKQISSLNDSSNFSDHHSLSRDLDSKSQNQELDEVKNEMEMAKKKLRQAERQNMRMKRNMEKMNNLEAEKKKLQRLVIDLNRQKVEHVELVLQTMFEVYQKGRDAKIF